MKERLVIEKTQEVLSLVTNIAFSNVSCWYDATRRDLHMDLIVPKNRQGHQPCPVIVWICGGAYMVVDRSVWMPELLHFARAGYVVASIEYRTSNEAQFPAQLIDVKAAIRYLKAHATEYCIDPEQIYVMGESAGGTLACLAGTTAAMEEYEKGDHLAYDSTVKGVVDFYGITELTETSLNTGGAVPSWTIEAFLGGNYTYDQANAASAVHFVTPSTPPFMILHGTADALIPMEQSLRLYDALLHNGVRAEYLEIEGAAHGDDMFYQDEVIRRILAFLSAEDRKEGAPSL